MPKKRLIEKYGIPISYLEFEYIKNCKNARDIEKIVAVLRSGEEGYFPDLTKCAEEKLKELAPQSKHLRTEQKIINKNNLCKSEWDEEGEPVIEWTNEVKLKDNFLSIIANEKKEEDDLPPIRNQDKKKIIFGEQKNSQGEQATSGTTTSSDRIKSTDYRQWDKYDADTECLKMDLDEDRAKEDVERENFKNIKRNDSKIIPIDDDMKVFNKLSNVEKETLSIMHKNRGNECYKSKEYENAVAEYTKCINILPTAVGYNNRAITYIKLLNYNASLEDLNKCLEIEPTNIKALLRKGLAFLGLDKRRDAYNVYAKVISIEPSNVTAINSLNDIKKDLPSLAPPEATRINIQDNGEDLTPKTVDLKKTLKSNATESQKNNVEIKGKIENKVPQPKVKTSKPEPKKPISVVDNYEQEDLSKLIIPKKFVKNKFAKTLSEMGQKMTTPQKKLENGGNEKKRQIITRDENIKIFPSKSKENGILIQEI